MAWPTGWMMIVIILKPEFLKRGHFTSRIHVSQRCDYSKYNNNIWTSIFSFFAICSQFINFVHRIATWRDLIWFTIFILKSNFYKFMLWKLTYRVWKYQKFLNLGMGHSPLPQTPPLAERKNQYCGRTTFQHVAPPLCHTEPRKPSWPLLQDEAAIILPFGGDAWRMGHVSQGGITESHQHDNISCIVTPQAPSGCEGTWRPITFMYMYASKFYNIFCSLYGESWDDTSATKLHIAAVTTFMFGCELHVMLWYMDLLNLEVRDKGLDPLRHNRWASWSSAFDSRSPLLVNAIHHLGSIKTSLYFLHAISCLG